jgi:hypothetical protein
MNRCGRLPERTCVGALRRPLPADTTTAHAGGWTASGAANRWRVAGLSRELRAQVLIAAISDPVIRNVRRTRVGACHVRTKLQAS